jgi:hypothetical protein
MSDQRFSLPNQPYLPVDVYKWDALSEPSVSNTDAGGIRSLHRIEGLLNNTAEHIPRQAVVDRVAEMLEHLHFYEGEDTRLAYTVLNESASDEPVLLWTTVNSGLIGNPRNLFEYAALGAKFPETKFVIAHNPGIDGTEGHNLKQLTRLLRQGQFTDSLIVNHYGMLQSVFRHDGIEPRHLYGVRSGARYAQAYAMTVEPGVLKSVGYESPAGHSYASAAQGTQEHVFREIGNLEQAYEATTTDSLYFSDQEMAEILADLQQTNTRLKRQFGRVSLFGFRGRPVQKFLFEPLIMNKAADPERPAVLRDARRVQERHQARTTWIDYEWSESRTIDPQTVLRYLGDVGIQAIVVRDTAMMFRASHPIAVAELVGVSIGQGSVESSA